MAKIEDNHNLRRCSWMGEEMLFHMWMIGTPFHYFSHGGPPPKQTVGLLEDKDGKIVLAKPEDIRFWDSKEMFEDKTLNGEWILNTNDFTPKRRCSICGYNKPVIAGEDVKQEPENYCPNCGAKMDKED